jgi:XTP/dITP diphosphohydrolase
MLVFATNNSHKLEEARQILSQPVLSLREVGINCDIPETGFTLKENALQKARFIFDLLNNSEEGNTVAVAAGFAEELQGVFADDTGLEVTALNNEPQVFSARYANFPLDIRIADLPLADKLRYAAMPDPPFGNNINKVLKLLEPYKTLQERRACFKTVICLIVKSVKGVKGEMSDMRSEVCFFEGRVDGYILFEPCGEKGFGYDGIFCPQGYETAGINGEPKSFAMLSAQEKNAISHRGIALREILTSRY